MIIEEKAGEFGIRRERSTEDAGTEISFCFFTKGWIHTKRWEETIFLVYPNLKLKEVGIFWSGLP